MAGRGALVDAFILSGSDSKIPHFPIFFGRRERPEEPERKTALTGHLAEDPQGPRAAKLCRPMRKEDHGSAAPAAPRDDPPGAVCDRVAHDPVGKAQTGP